MSKKKSNKRNAGILIRQLAKLQEKESTDVNGDVINKQGKLLQLTSNRRTADETKQGRVFSIRKYF